MSSDETFRDPSRDHQQPISMGDGSTVWPSGSYQGERGGSGVDPAWPAPDPRHRAPEPVAYAHPQPETAVGGGATPPPAGWGAGTVFAEPGAGATAPAAGGRARHRAGRPVMMLAAVALVAALAGGGAATLVNQWDDSASGTVGSSGSVSGSPVSTSGSNAVSAVASAVSPSVVEIKATLQGGQATGSGVIISEDGEIVTNNHVISGAQQITVQFNDGSTAEAEVVGTNADNDIALIKVSGKSGLKAAALGDSDKAKVGDEVVAIGSPEGLTGTVTSGIISAKDRDVTVQKDQDQSQQQSQGQWPFGFGGQEYNGSLGSGETTTYKALQTDASINPGNSGGPLVNMNGEVIAINSAMYSSSNSSDAGSVGLGFAIPVNDVKKIVDDLRNN
ncbi:trypsin-like peptidase domain-containing protein [Streptomyces sp. NPDC051940]|uniref:S1C family serine protease n=1 Tax=Streptomyces sp. NPDC051940 TaxID=3155675 RepID=UPI003441F2D7